MSFTQISTIINKRFNSGNLSRKVSAALVCDEFNEIILDIWGDKIKHQAQAMYVKEKILTVACLSSVVAQEIKIREGELIKKIGDKFGPRVVDRLRLLT